MRRWETPRAEVEEFMPNEYCSSCWGVACEIGPANEYDKKKLGENSHRLDHCGNPGNQVLKDLGKDGIADVMQEVGTDGLGTLDCKIYSDQYYSQSLAVSQVHPGDRIYWTTSVTDRYGTRTWHHQGWVQETVKGHPHRS